MAPTFSAAGGCGTWNNSGLTTSADAEDEEVALAPAETGLPTAVPVETTADTAAAPANGLVSPADPTAEALAEPAADTK